MEGDDCDCGCDEESDEFSRESAFLWGRMGSWIRRRFGFETCHGVPKNLAAMLVTVELIERRARRA